MQKLVAQAHRVALVRFDAESTAHIDGKIQPGCTGHVDWNWLVGGNNPVRPKGEERSRVR